MIYKETHKERQMGQSIKSYFLLESGRFDIFEIVMVLKILYIYIWCFFYGQYEFLIPPHPPPPPHPKFWWPAPKLWLIKVWWYFQQKLIFRWKSIFDTNCIQKPT